MFWRCYLRISKTSTSSQGPLVTNCQHLWKSLRFIQIFCVINVSPKYNSTYILSFPEQSELPKKLFSSFLESIGWKKVEHLVSMTWNEILTVRGPILDSKQFQKCKEVFHPDHFLVSSDPLNDFVTSIMNNMRLTKKEAKLLHWEPETMAMKTQISYDFWLWYHNQIIKNFRHCHYRLSYEIQIW